MAKYFAELNDENIVLRVIVGKDLADVQRLLPGTWVETYTDTPGKNYAGIEYTYDPVKTNFIAPKPYLSWILDETDNWQPPVSCPTDGKFYGWDEATVSWVERNPLG